MTEAERQAELERLIEEQRRDDTHIVYPDGRLQIPLDAPFINGSDGSGFDGFSNLVGVDDEGEVISFIRERRGSVLNGDAIYHGTAGGYGNHGCRCPRCKKAWNEKNTAYQKRRRRERPPLECPTCGETFPHFGHRRYCSDPCRERARKRRNAGLPERDPMMQCQGPGCDNEFVARNARKRFCSGPCRTAAWKQEFGLKAAA